MESLQKMSATAEARPLLGRRGRPGAARFLLVCFYDPTGIATVYENVAMWQRLSEFELEVLNLWPTHGARLRLPRMLELADYDGIIIHAAVSYTFGNLKALDSTLTRPFEEYDGIKVLMRQDEQQLTSLFAEYLGRKQFDVLLTCVPESELPKAYPRTQVGDLAIVQVLTGYITQMMRDMASPWSRSRPVDIGYRGSIQPLWFGRLGFEKRKIGDDVALALTGRLGKHLDISSRREDRLNGSAWSEFLVASKATLGVESGSNLFDFDGQVEQWCRDFEASHPEMDKLSEAFYRMAHDRYLRQFEGNIDYAQISPRHFEAAAARSVQILYEGRYSNILIPQRHFLPLARDLSNLDEVVDALADERRCVELTERSFTEIIRNPSYGYEAFVAKIDAALDSALARKGRARRTARSVAAHRPRALVLTAADPLQDPRFEWFARSLARDHEVCEIGTYRFGADGGGPTAERLADNRLRLRVERTRHGGWWVPPATAVDRSLSLGRQKLLYLAVLADASEDLLRSSIGALDAAPEDIAQFRELARHILNSNAALLEAAQRTGRFDLVVATDLDTLPAGVVLRDETGALLLYDAHEFWPYALHGMRHWQCEFWAAFSRELVAEADLAVTVSPPLAKVMAAEYGREFSTVPNCASLADASAVDIDRKLAPRAGRTEIVFLYQGAFAPGRGIDRLISSWQHVDRRGRLLLRGPDNDYKTAMVGLARSLALLDRYVFFPSAVSEHELITAAASADVGVIPYEPISVNNRLACPNKLSQYLCAGLPVICNELEFVRAVVVDNGFGYSVDFSDEDATAALFDKVIAAADEIPEMARRARSYFESYFHWEKAFEPVRLKILDTERARPPLDPGQPIDLGWIADTNAMRSQSAANSESARLSQIYATEIQRLNKIDPSEIQHLNTHYPTMIASLNDEIERLREIVSIGSNWHKMIMIQSDRFGQAVRTVIAGLRLRASVLRLRAGVLRLLLSDAGGFAALAAAAKERCFDRAFLAQAARVVAARKLVLDGGGPGAALAAHLADGVLELRAKRGRSAQASRPSFPLRTEVASAAGARRIRSLTLTIDAGIAARPALLAEGGYELPELLRWFERRPQLAAALIWGDTSRETVDTGRAVVF
jgi:glycosyltransferase involved in cell wall biosynthesis